MKIYERVPVNKCIGNNILILIFIIYAKPISQEIFELIYILNKNYLLQRCSGHSNHGYNIYKSMHNNCQICFFSVFKEHLRFSAYGKPAHRVDF